MIHIIFQIYTVMLLMRIFLSWTPTITGPFIRFVFDMTEPLLAPIRKILPVMRVDFSPLILFLILQIIERALLSFIH